MKPGAATDASARRCPQRRGRSPQARRGHGRRSQIPAGTRHVQKWRLAPAMIDELLGWGLRPSILVADPAAATAGRCPISSKFVFQRVAQPDRASLRPPGRGPTRGALHRRHRTWQPAWLIAEWPPGESEPIKY
ncbi:transposase [Actinoplanes sp. NPDC051343]|uniref:transposase n=1 Tax=Actinoplanes sp. NPDC051343 TaxID=3363906 RepID=UPI0037A0AFF1